MEICENPWPWCELKWLNLVVYPYTSKHGFIYIITMKDPINCIEVKLHAVRE
jgi:hypothetical protein